MCCMRLLLPRRTRILCAHGCCVVKGERRGPGKDVSYVKDGWRVEGTIDTALKKLVSNIERHSSAVESLIFFTSPKVP
jgi:hypothetical protein